MNIYLKDHFVPSDNNDNTLSVISALSALNNGDTLCLGGGVLHFYPEFAASAEYFVPQV